MGTVQSRSPFRAVQSPLHPQTGKVTSAFQHEYYLHTAIPGPGFVSPLSEGYAHAGSSPRDKKADDWSDEYLTQHLLRCLCMMSIPTECRQYFPTVPFPVRPVPRAWRCSSEKRPRPSGGRFLCLNRSQSFGTCSQGPGPEALSSVSRRMNRGFHFFFFLFWPCRLLLCLPTSTLHYCMPGLNFYLGSVSDANRNVSLVTLRQRRIIRIICSQYAMSHVEYLPRWASHGNEAEAREISRPGSQNLGFLFLSHNPCCFHGADSPPKLHPSDGRTARLGTENGGEEGGFLLPYPLPLAVGTPTSATGASNVLHAWSICR